MDLHNDIAKFLSSYHSSLVRTYAGSAAHLDDPNAYYIVVHPDQRMDNGEHSQGVLKVKISLVTISLHTKGDISELSTPQSYIETALAVRQRQIDEHWLQGCILQNVNKFDLSNDPEGREEGIPDIMLSYKVAWRRTA